MADKHSDPETALLKGLAKIEKEVRSLKTRLGKLTNRIEQLELMGFQEQLNSLNGCTTELSNRFIEASRDIASLRLSFSTKQFRSIIMDSKISPDKKLNLTTQLVADTSRTRAELYTSDNPNKIFQQFQDNWESILSSSGFSMTKY